MLFSYCSIQLGYGILSGVTEHLARAWPMAKQWPVACAGFSGGAKRSGSVAAALARDRWRVVGIFMGGCNEDFATLGYQLSQPPPAFKNVPIFLSNGDADRIAGAESGVTVKRAMEQSGFKKVRSEVYEGGHRLDTEHLTVALRWFLPPPSSGQ